MGLRDEYDVDTVDEENTVEYELEEDPYAEEDDATYQAVDEAFLKELEEQTQPYQQVSDDFIEELEEQRQKRREMQRAAARQDTFRQDIREWAEEERSGADVRDIARVQCERQRTIRCAAAGAKDHVRQRGRRA